VLLAEAPGEGLPGFVKMVAADEVVIEFTNPTPAVRPGLTAQVRIRLR